MHRKPLTINNKVDKNKNLFYILGGGVLLLLMTRIGEKIMVSKQTKINFKKTLKPIADKIEAEYGIKPIITISQSALESRWGVSGLTKIANNLFGFTASEKYVKSGKPVVYMPTREYIAGVWVTVKRPFRKYKSWYDSVNDWARVISTLTRYNKAHAYSRIGDVKNFSRAVQEGGYATDPRYAQKVIAHAVEVDAIKLAGTGNLGEVPIPKNAKRIKFIKKEEKS